MNKLLNQFGIQYKQSGQWLLYSKYHNQGYTHSKTIDIVRIGRKAGYCHGNKMDTKGTTVCLRFVKG